MAHAASKCWTVVAIATAEEPLKIRCDDAAFDQGSLGTLGKASPVEYLLISVASCFALSLRMAMTERHLAPKSFTVGVVAAKAPTPPSRLHALELEVQLPEALNDERYSLIRRAKELCTVTNTLTQPPQLRVVAHDPAA